MSFERLRVYQAAELLVQCVMELLKSVPPGHAKDVDQLKRASSSIPYNIAEALDRSIRDKKYITWASREAQQMKQERY